MPDRPSGQITIIDLVDGYNVQLSNYSVTLDGAVNTLGTTQTYVVRVSAFRGEEKLTPTIGTVTCPTNVSASVGTAVSQVVPITITFNSSLSSAGTVTIPVTAGEVQITKEFSFSIAFKGDPGAAGATGSKGDTGDSGRGILHTDIEYGTSGNAATQPTGWTSDVPTSLNEGDWLWVKTVITYTDSTTNTSYQKSYIGTDGEDGKSVYIQSATKTGDTTTVIIEDSDGNTTTLTIQDGADGATGASGQNGLSGYVHTAWANSSNGSVDFSTTVSANKQYLGVYTDNTAADSQDYTKYSWSLIKGAKGDTGDTGVSVATVTNYYLATSQSSGVTRDTSGWTTSIQTMTSSDQFLWNYEVVTGDDNSTLSITDPVIIGRYGQDGATGATGDSGKGITGITEYYLATSASDGVTTSTSGWTTTVQATTTTNKYLWNYEVVTYTSGAPYTSDPRIIGTHGDTGSKGDTGDDGRGIDNTEIKYGTSNDAATQPSSWSSSAPTSLTKGKWLWVRTVITYTDSTTNTTYQKSYIGTDGDDGKSVYIQSATKTGDVTTVVIADTDGNTNTLTIQDGTDGATGATGQNGLSGYVHTAWANSANGSVDFSTTVSANKQYLGVYTDNTQADSQTYSDYSWSLIKGAKGDTGDDGAKGDTGDDGRGISSTEIKYGTSNDASTQPSSWSTSAPTSITKGKWLWVRTVTAYTDSSTDTTYQKSYIGTDGDDGKSIYIQSATKTGDVTTVVIADTDGNTNTLTIQDGADGATGATGSNGLSGYVHTAWANSSNGSVDFSTTVSANKQYLGVYTDNTQADSQTYSDYSWSLIKGAKGDTGDDGAKGDTGDTGPQGATGDTGPEAVVNISISSIDWSNNTATLTATLRVNGSIVTPSTYKWTKGSATTSLGTSATLTVNDLDAVYNCTVTW